MAAGGQLTENTLRELEIDPAEYKVYPGFFRDSLSSELISSGELKPALYIDIDCDLYISTYEALDFMFANDLVRTGTYIGYDDWGDTKLYLEGERRGQESAASPSALLSANGGFIAAPEAVSNSM